MKYMWHWFLIVVVSLQDLSCHKRWNRRSQHHSLMTRKLAWSPPARGGRRQEGAKSPLEMLLQQQKKASVDHEIHDFYQPYEALGDFVFLRTTKPPKDAVTEKNDPDHTMKGYGHNFDLDFYDKAKIEDYRGCNLVCPALFIKYGPVCGWAKVKYRGWFWQVDTTFGNHWNGSHDVLEIRDFDSICAMLAANCRDYSKAGTTYDHWKRLTVKIPSNNYVRRVFRLLHLGHCGEGIDAQETVKPWKYGQFEDTKQNELSYWEKETDKIMDQANNVANFPTRKTTRIVAMDVDDFSFIGK